jgi:hypothetical protein
MNPEQFPGGGGNFIGTVSYTDCNGNAQSQDVFANDYFEICAQEGTVVFNSAFGQYTNIVLIGDCLA